MPSNVVGCTSDGQLIMLALPAAQQCGLQVKVLGSHIRSCVFRVHNQGILVPDKNWIDKTSLAAFAQMVGKGNPVTTEWENIPVETLEILAELGLVPRPNIAVIRQIQDRVTEKELAARAGGRPVPFEAVNSLEELKSAVRRLEPPCILKTRKGGYDGKGQWKIDEITSLEDLWNRDLAEFVTKEKLGEIPPLILEKMIHLDYEVSVILGRDHTGTIEALGPVYSKTTGLTQ